MICMKQNGIENILKKHQQIPVVTVSDMNEVEQVRNAVAGRGIQCVEITLRTPFAWDAIRHLKDNFSDELSVGVGTVCSENEVGQCVKYGVDFIVSPGSTVNLINSLEKSGIPFLPGVATPSEIIQALEQKCDHLKFFPANLFGGIEALKMYGALFNAVKFCPTGGINETNYREYLKLDNVLSVGGSWLCK